MSEAVQDNPPSVPASSGLSSPTPGSLLAAGRQKMGWSIGDVAAKLRMSVQQVDALEQADYSRLPTGTFLRGFVRSYAKLVSLDPAQVLESLEETHPDGRRPSIVVPTQNIAVSVSGERFSAARSRLLLVAILLLALAGGGTYWWVNIRPDPARLADGSAGRPASHPVAVPVPAQTAPSATETPAPAAASEAASTAAAGTTPAAQPVSSPAASAPAAVEPQPAALTQTEAPLVAPAGQGKPVAVPKGSGSLRFSFSGECWVEVTEASGKTLLSRRFSAGEAESVVGKLPLSVAIGNAPVTRLKYNDVDFDLAPHTRVAVARFTLK